MLALGIWSFRSTHHTLNSKNPPKILGRSRWSENCLPWNQAYQLGGLRGRFFRVNPAKGALIAFFSLARFALTLVGERSAHSGGGPWKK
jgi:hypothetical protein